MSKSRITLYSLLSMLAGLVVATAEPVPAPTLPTTLDLPQALAMAMEHNPEINEARERIREQEGVLEVSLSSRRPDINGFGTYTWEEDTRTGSFGGPVMPDDTYWRAGVELTQPLYAGGVLNAAVRSRRFELEALLQQVKATEARVMADVYRKYYNALLAREIIAVRRESMALLENQRQLALNRFEAGAGARFDVLQADVRVANARPPLIRAENDYLVAIDDLRTTLGAVFPDQATPADITLSDRWNQPELTMDLPSAIQQAVAERPEMQQAIMAREAAREWVRRVSRQRAPQINFFANYAAENDRFAAESTTLDGWQAGVSASLRIWEGGRIRGEVAQAQSQYDQLKLQEQTLRLDIELEVRTAWTGAAEARAILDASVQTSDLATEALRLAENRYAAGAITQLDVLTSQLELTQAKLERITAERNYALAFIDLERATGRLIPPDSGLD